MYAVLVSFLCLGSADAVVQQRPPSFKSLLGQLPSPLGKSPVTTRVSINQPQTKSDPLKSIAPEPTPPRSLRPAAVSAPVPPMPDVWPPPEFMEPAGAPKQPPLTRMINGSLPAPAPDRAAPARTSERSGAPLPQGSQSFIRYSLYRINER